jgi:ferritin
VDTKLIDQLLDTIGNVIDAEGNWKDKQAAILESCDTDQKTNLFEFLSWFDNEGEEEDENHREQNDD